jgi:hypothetical protein
MPFQKGNDLHKKRSKIGRGGGRPTKVEHAYLDLQRQAFIKEAWRDGALLGRRCRARALKNDQLLGKYLDNAIKEDDRIPPGRPVAIQIIHEGRDVDVKSQGNGISIHIGSDDTELP